MGDKVKQILQAAELLRRGDVASGMRQILGATSSSGLGKLPTISAQLVSRTLSGLKSATVSGGPASLNVVPAPVLESLAPQGLPHTAGGCDGAAGALATLGFQGAADSNSAVLASLGLLGLPSTQAAGTDSTAALLSSLGSLGIDASHLANLDVVRLQALQEAAQQQYLAAYAQQLQEAQELHDKHQEAAQLALIMEAAEAQAEAAKQSLEDDKEEHHWHRRLGKGKVCGHWQRGHCQRGNSCSFNHPEKERGTMQTRGPADIMRHNFKTGLCKFFMAGNCPQSTRCMFAHGPQDLRAPGMALSKDEEEIVQKVAQAKAASMAKLGGPSSPASSSSAVVVPAAKAAPEAAPLLASSLLTTAQGGGALTTSTAGAATSLAEQQLQSKSAQLMALANLLANGRPAPAVLPQGAVAPAPVRPRSAGPVTIAPPQLSPAALALLSASQGAVEGSAAKRQRLGAA